MKTRNIKKILVALIVIIVVVIFVGINLFWSFNDHTYVATVTNKERIADGEDSYYLIFCQDDNGNYYEFKNEDNFLRGKFDSSTVYNKLEKGQTYKFTVVGFRIGFFSEYENIINFEEID